MDVHFLGTLCPVLQGQGGHCWRQLGAAGRQRDSSEQGVWWVLASPEVTWSPRDRATVSSP